MGQTYSEVYSFPCLSAAALPLPQEEKAIPETKMQLIKARF